MDRMDHLIAFLRARLDDDEQTARAAGQLPAEDPWDSDPTAHWRAKTSPYHGVGGAVRWYVEDGHEDGVVGHVDPQAAQDDDIARHIVRHDPAQVLAEVDAKRRVLDYAEQRAAIKQGEDDDDWENIQEATLGTVLRFLTLPYAAHPDYRDAWRP